MKAIGESCGRTLAQVKAEYKKIGDLGEGAVNLRARQKTLFKSKPLTVRGVFDELKKVAKTSGKDVSRRFFLSLSFSLSVSLSLSLTRVYRTFRSYSRARLGIRNHPRKR